MSDYPDLKEVPAWRDVLVERIANLERKMEETAPWPADFPQSNEELHHRIRSVIWETEQLKKPTPPPDLAEQRNENGECEHGVKGEPCPDCIKAYHADEDLAERLADEAANQIEEFRPEILAKWSQGEDAGSLIAGLLDPFFRRAVEGRANDKAQPPRARHGAETTKLSRRAGSAGAAC